MKRFLKLLLVAGVAIPVQLSGQIKIAYDLSNFHPVVFSDPRISDDGKFVLFSESTHDTMTLIIKDHSGRLLARLPGATDATFSGDNRVVTYHVGDTVRQFDLLRKSIVTAHATPSLPTTPVFPAIHFADTSWQLNEGSEEYSPDSSFILFSAGLKKNDPAEHAIVWRWQDIILPPQRAIEKDQWNTCWFSYDIARKKIAQLTQPGQQRMFSITTDQNIGVLDGAHSQEGYWLEAAKPSYYLVSLVNGHLQPIVEKRLVGLPSLSPDKKFLVYFNYGKKAYCSYSIATAQTKTISTNVSTPLQGNPVQTGARYAFNFGIGGWNTRTQKVLVYDEFDIYALDLNGMDPPVNTTNGYGWKNRIVLRVAAIGDISLKDFSNDQHILLSAFDTHNKQNGFYRQSQGDPLKLSMGDYLQQYPFGGDMLQQPVIKAKHADAYIVHRESATSPIHFSYTTDFKHFTPLCDTNSLHSYNLARTRLLQWTSDHHRSYSGILYTPTDFDPTKKYPVIFYLYEDNTNLLNYFTWPKLSDGRLPIQTFVSNGYLVFDPAIQYTLSHPGESALKTLIAAAKHLSTFSFVDSTKFGLQGISWGAFQINYILTKTNLFAAAASSAGVSDLVSNYNNLRPGQGISAQFHSEISQGRMGGTLWEKKREYMENTPVLGADKVTTPLLIEHNEGDEAVPFSQGLEWFLALRRLQKRVWLLQYKGEGHGIYNRTNQLDYTLKLSQFFDHYLKGKPVPQWMRSTTE